MSGWFFLPGDDGGGGLVVARRGRVRLAGHGLADDAGRFFGLGPSMFWSPWGWRHDHDRWLKNCDYCGQRGADLTRDFAFTAWGPDRIVNPKDEGFDLFIDTTVAWVKAKWALGLRSWFTFYPGRDFLSHDERVDLATRLAKALDMNCPEAIVGYSVGNETGKFLTVEENHQIAEAIRRGAPLALIGLGAAEQFDDPSQLYAGHTAATMRETDLERTAGGYEDPPGVYHPNFRSSRQGYGQEPDWNDVEPVGPYTSPSETNPFVLVSSRRMVMMNRGAISIYHASGVGTSGGSQIDLDNHKPANWWEVENVEATFQGLRTLRATLPEDIADWGGTIHTHFSHEGQLPFHVQEGSDWDREGFPPMETRCYTAQRGAEFRSIVLGQVHPIHWIARYRQAVTVRHLLTGEVKQARELEAEEALLLDADQPSQFIEGRAL